ncbi:uncharacterized protein CEXT_149371 [Caerostris extrusa]|uniref:Endonuclease/exonuclease/phosphatase domain-containing protein n=1 Tax=Caerostris extrusa TaxID=172846 RepID=A0AAV4NIW8_CAEEX|nr:uncharacterized protein CEXT_149371 [Caerostris extrusa]
MSKELERFQIMKRVCTLQLYTSKTIFVFAVLCAKPGSTVDEILDAVEEAAGDECDEYQTILAGDFNINMSTEVGRTFCEVLRDVYWLHLRTNPSHWTTRGRTSIDAVFSTHDLKCCGVYESTFSYHVPLYGRLYIKKCIYQ